MFARKFVAWAVAALMALPVGPAFGLTRSRAKAAPKASVRKVVLARRAPVKAAVHKKSAKRIVHHRRATPRTAIARKHRAIHRSAGARVASLRGFSRTPAHRAAVARATPRVALPSRSTTAVRHTTPARVTPISRVAAPRTSVAPRSTPARTSTAYPMAAARTTVPR